MARSGQSGQPTLAGQMEQNLAEHASHLHRGTPGMTVHQAADLVIADSGLDDDTFNFVGAASFSDATRTRPCRRDSAGSRRDG